MHNDPSEALGVAQRMYAHPFYRARYPQFPRTWDEVPCIDRSDLQSVQYTERLAVPFSEVELLRVTSGTSCRGLLLMPRGLSAYDLASPIQADVYREHMIQRLATFSGAQPHTDRAYYSNLGIATIGIDLTTLGASARIIDEFQPDMVAGTAHALIRFLPMLTDQAKKNIRVVQVFGERAGNAGWRCLQEMMAHAVFFTEYALIESQASMGTPCATIRRSRQFYVHAVPGVSHLELLHGSRSVSEVGEEGEVVITTVRPSAFPLVRYRTGDWARIAEQDCPCGMGAMYDILGRMETDRVRVSDGEINVWELERAITATLASEGKVSIDFCAVIHDTVPPGLVIRTDIEVTSGLARRIENELRISACATYADAVRDKTLAPLRFESGEVYGAAGKRSRLRVEHV